MGIQLNKFFLIILVLFSSCKGDVQENYAVSKKTRQTVKTASINFFDKKYTTQYTMIVDESTPADHPIKTFLDCTKSYFTIHYIPKNQELEKYWMNEYFKNKDFDNINFEKESKEIGKKINESSKDYAIFCYYIPSKFLKSNAGCSSESVYLDDKTIANIFYYNNQENKWESIKTESSNVLPRILESKYFKTNFSSYFVQDKRNKKPNKNLSKTKCKEVKGVMLYGEECIVSSNSLENVYNEIIDQKLVRDSEFLLKTLPKTNTFAKINENGIAEIKYKINSNSVIIGMFYEGGITDIELYKQNESVKRKIVYNVD